MDVKNFKRLLISIPKSIELNSESKAKLILVWDWVHTRPNIYFFGGKAWIPIKICNWHYSKIRVIGNVVDSIIEPRKNNQNYFYKKYNFIYNPKYYF